MEPRLERVRSLIRTRQHRHYADAPVDDGDLFALTEVARWSGSSANSQPWRFIVIRDEQMLRKIADLGMPNTRGLQTARAAIAIAIPDEERKAISRAYDEGRAAERLLIGAAQLGLGAGISWLPPDPRRKVGELLGVPETHMVRTIVGVGHVGGAGRERKSAAGSARLPRDEVVMEERWHAPAQAKRG